jgi:hypothetical protein
MKPRMLNVKVAALVGAMLVTAAPAFAQAEKATDPVKKTEKADKAEKKVLKAGDRAPEFKVEKFIKGEPDDRL